MNEENVRQEQTKNKYEKKIGEEKVRERPLVAPFARALSLLAAFGNDERWLGNLELSKRTGLPSSTVTRMAQSLVSLGYLHYEESIRKFSLAPSVLALGYGVVDPPSVKKIVRERMSDFTRSHNVHLILCSRDKLDLIVIDSHRTQAFPESLQLETGARIDLTTPVAGWALMAGLPEHERSYLSESLERKKPQSWRPLHRKFNDALNQVHKSGFCSSPLESNFPIPMVAAPLKVSDSSQLAIACMAPLSKMPRARLEFELGPALVSMATMIENEGITHEIHR